jgi:hypothetical protein
MEKVGTFVTVLSSRCLFGTANYLPFSFTDPSELLQRDPVPFGGLGDISKLLSMLGGQRSAIKPLEGQGYAHNPSSRSRLVRGLEEAQKGANEEDEALEEQGDSNTLPFAPTGPMPLFNALPRIFETMNQMFPSPLLGNPMGVGFGGFGGFGGLGGLGGLDNLLAVQWTEKRTPTAITFKGHFPKGVSAEDVSQGLLFVLYPVIILASNDD